MNHEFVKTLWGLRFEKMRKVEEASAWSYQDLLSECIAEWGADSKPAQILSTLVREERSHEKLAEKLIDMLKNYGG